MWKNKISEQINTVANNVYNSLDRAIENEYHYIYKMKSVKINFY
jgi:hypothetical protein